MNKVEEFISVVRDSFVGSQEVFTNGSCYHFYLILKTVFPEAEAYYDTYHVITKIDGKYYDITGEIKEDTAMYHMTTPASYNLKVPYNIYKDPNKPVAV